MSEPWVHSDTWYRIAGPERFLNVRTGVLSDTVPDGTHNGTRRRSSADSGTWSVPFQTPPPELPAELALPLAVNVQDQELVLVEAFGTSDLTFTAPHGVNLERDGKPEHLPEDFTAYLARAWAAHTGGLALSWPFAALEWCAHHEKPLPGARDPNYLTFDEAAGNAWVRALKLHRLRGLHVDVHGKADRDGEASCDVGVGALRAGKSHKTAEAVVNMLASALQGVLTARGFSVDSAPRLQGCWRSVPRQTLTQSSCKLGYTPVQLELGYALRRELGRDRRFCLQMAEVFRECASAAHRFVRGEQQGDPQSQPDLGVGT